MYCKLFASLYQGTLRGRSNEILVFTNLLANCDKEGYVDKHFRAIADEVGLSIEAVKAAIEHLEAPDEESRSPEEDGRRLLRINDHRAWGWLVVNYTKYRSIRSDEDRREQNREAQKRWRDKHGKPRVSQRKPQSAQGEGDAEGKGEGEETKKSSEAPPPPPPVQNKARGTLEELRAYSLEIGLLKLDGESMFDHWEANGWKNGNHAVKDWKAGIRKWKSQGWLPSQKNTNLSDPPEAKDIQPVEEIDLYALMMENRAKREMEERAQAGNPPEEEGDDNGDFS